MLAEIILSNKALVTRYLAGFDDASALAQPPGLPNHAIWNLGHLALTMHRVAAMLDGQALPASDFVTTGTKRGSRARGHFDTDSVAFGSSPAASADDFPTLARAIEIFSAAVDRLAAAASNASDADLDKPFPWGHPSSPFKWYVLAARMLFHNGFHTGQIADTRRALAFKSVFA